MLAIYASTALILAASLLLGRAILGLLGWPRPAWLAGAVGFATLVVGRRLPDPAARPRHHGRGRDRRAVRRWPRCGSPATASRRAARRAWPVGGRGGRDRHRPRDACRSCSTSAIGVLGEGIYTNDHAAQLYWTDWLQNGFGPEPSAVRFGYPIGPQAVAVIAAEVTGSSLVSAFNGLLLAIPALTGLAALGALRELPAGRRIAVAAICGLPYLGASFLAQSAFKETAMALFVLAFAVALAGLSGLAVERDDAPPRRAVLGSA